MTEAIQTTETRRNAPERCVVVVDSALPAGRAANASAVLSLTVGQRHPGLVGAPLIDADGGDMPGLIPIGIAVLAAEQEQLVELAAAADIAGLDVVRFPVEGQQTKNYGDFLDAMTKVGRAHIRYVGLALVGDRKPISKLVGKLPLLGQEPS